MEGEDPVVEESPKERKRLNIWLIVALLAAVAAGVLLASTVWDGRWAGNVAAFNETAPAQPADPQTWCAPALRGMRRWFLPRLKVSLAMKCCRK